MIGQSDGAQKTLDQRNALYVAAQQTVGRLDALDPFGDDLPVAVKEIQEVRQQLAEDIDRIIPPRDAILEEI
jgi:hypothetical protein